MKTIIAHLIRGLTALMTSNENVGEKQINKQNKNTPHPNNKNAK